MDDTLVMTFYFLSLCSMEYVCICTLLHSIQHFATQPSLETFEGYRKQPDTSIEDLLINFGQHDAKLKDFDILLPKPVLAFRALKSANLTPEYEKVSQGYDW